MSTSAVTPRPRLDTGPGPRPDRACLRLAVLLVVAVAAGGVTVGVTSFSATGPAGGPIYSLPGDRLDVLLQVLGRNLATGLLLFSGYATLGTTTLLGLTFTSAWVGAGSAAVVAETGLAHVSPLVLLYLPCEFGGLLLAAAAGLLPLAHGLRRFAADGRIVRHSHARPALVLLAVALSLIALGAGLELLVIDLHHA